MASKTQMDDIELREHSQPEIHIAEEEEAPTNLVTPKISGEIKEEKLVSNDVVASIVNELITNDADIDCIEKLRPTETVTMCRVPEEIIGYDDNDRGYFNPKVISIGPYHSKNEVFYPMQNLKLRYLNDLLRRSTDNNRVEKYTKAIENQLVTEKAKYCEFAVCGISDAEFLKLLVLDGCFVVEFLLKYAERPIFTLPGIDVDLLRHDLVLIENQVPFSVLEIIHELTEYDYILELKEKCSIFDLAAYYISGRENLKDISHEIKEDGKMDHFLHLFYTILLMQYKRQSCSDLAMVFWVARVYVISPLMFVFLLIRFPLIIMVRLLYYLIMSVECLTFGFTKDHRPTEYRHYRNKLKNYPRVMTTIPTAKDANYAGMGFSSRNFLRPYNMFFACGEMINGMKEINDNFFTEFENMLFYEQIYGFKITEKEIVWEKIYKSHWLREFYERVSGNYLKLLRRRSSISTDAVYMSHLVKTDMDVEVLKRYGMLRTTTTTHGLKEIAEFFGKRRPWLVLPEKEVKFLTTQFEAINKFFNRSDRIRKAKLTKDYFKNPLIIFSFIGFIFLIALAVVQTVFTVIK
ncbi:hypothetical protein ZOSMA_17G00710 [Zostera marina]|uniref:Uncharacterized protein n=1 Tax=Zostera marina TaxID=29655 RepID=A0A0K9PRB2_ZOSMR|nr:hypothetical protein ZOSMA_17G00710 [Zostera marina]